MPKYKRATLSPTLNFKADVTLHVRVESIGRKYVCLEFNGETHKIPVGGTLSVMRSFEAIMGDDEGYLPVSRPKKKA